MVEITSREAAEYRSTKRSSVFVTLADGLDRVADGRGWNARHERARRRAEASPRMLQMLKDILRQELDDDGDLILFADEGQRNRWVERIRRIVKEVDNG